MIFTFVVEKLCCSPSESVNPATVTHPSINPPTVTHPSINPPTVTHPSINPPTVTHQSVNPPTHRPLVLRPLRVAGTHHSLLYSASHTNW